MGGLDPIFDLVANSMGAIRSQPGYEAATLFLAGVFLWSGGAKLRQPRLAALAIADFGLVERPRLLYGVALATFELGLGAALVVGQAMSVILALACATLLGFSVLVVQALRRKESFACFCFGGEEKLSRLTLGRNLGLLGLATLLWSASLGTAERLGTGQELWLTGMIAVAALASAALLAPVPRLASWNWEVRDYHRTRAEVCKQ